MDRFGTQRSEPTTARSRREDRRQAPCMRAHRTPGPHTARPGPPGRSRAPSPPPAARPHHHPPRAGAHPMRRRPFRRCGNAPRRPHPRGPGRRRRCKSSSVTWVSCSRVRCSISSAAICRGSPSTMLCRPCGPFRRCPGNPDFAGTGASSANLLSADNNWDPAGAVPGPPAGAGPEAPAGASRLLSADNEPASHDPEEPAPLDQLDVSGAGHSSSLTKWSGWKPSTARPRRSIPSL